MNSAHAPGAFATLAIRLVSLFLLVAFSCAQTEVHAVSSKEHKPVPAGSGKQTPAKASKSGAAKPARNNSANSAEKGKKGKVARNSGKAAAAKSLSNPETLQRFEDEVMDMPAAERARALTMMLMLTSLVTPTLVEDADGAGRDAANYASGVALERLQKLVAKADMPAAAGCIGRFASVEKNPAKSMAFSFPKGCAGLRELHALDNGATTPKLEDLALKWATGTVQEGLAQARKAGFDFKARARPVSLAEANK